ncbi:MAG TPA: electron-transfer flavoprotein:ubiquinone oxidoreductase [Miltoncostaeaceae bacterium]|nr:electron-transfer flavoprotein:ubiquinone oxidoreductase [Miltoncostaeaceae bacterium]
MSIVPADYPPRFRASDYVVKPTAPEDERIEVGVLFVGAGPAGLAGAIRLGQLLAEDPEVAEGLGEVPIAVVDKGKGAGSHLLSGAVMRPGPFRSLFPDEDYLAIPGVFGEVTGEAVYFMMKSRAIRLPTPPQLKNHGNYVVSVSRLARWMAERAEELGAYMLGETDAQKLIVDEAGRVAGVVTGDKGRGREGEELPTFEPGVELGAQITVLAEGTAGHLTGVLRRQYELDAAPQTYELGVKEVWEVPRALGRVVHTLGWPLKLSPRYHEYGGSWIYPMGEDRVSIGFVTGLDYADATLSVHDLLQQFKSHRLVREILEGGKRVAWGAKTIPGGGFYSLPRRLHVPGALLCGDSAGFVNMSALKGVHYAIQSGILAAEAIYEALKNGKATTAAGLWNYDQRIQESFIWTDLWRERNVRPAFQRSFFAGGIVGGMATATRGKFPKHIDHQADADVGVFVGNRGDAYPKPDGQYFFDKLSSVFASGNKTRDDQPNHIRLQQHVPVELATMWVNMCPAQVYELGEGDGEVVEVNVNPSNCVQCGAITAKGGRLTPPEGGSGPEYTLT